MAFTSVFSRRDKIIDWRGCLDPGAQVVEVCSSHRGMAVGPVVFDVVTEALGVPREHPQTGATPAVTAATSGAAPVASAG